MRIHEYQAKQLFREAGIPVPRGMAVDTPDGAAAAFEQLGGQRAVIKAQIHAGGRGQGTVRGSPHQRGVCLVQSAEEAAEVAHHLLGHVLVTAQTGPEGRIVRQVLVEEVFEVAREIYVAALVDRKGAVPVLIASAEGGMDIEKLAAEKPEAILCEAFDAEGGLWPYQARKLAARLGLSDLAAREAESLFQNLCKFFLHWDCSLAEINPLVVTQEGHLCALDAKVNFDDNALYRHLELVNLRDIGEEDPREVRAAQEGLSYVRLDGNIGCLVNGAGLAMSTMDLIQLHGGQPANFLDVGGGANVHQVTEAFRILMGDPQVQAVLVNIFGGIMRCTIIAQALVEACRTLELKVPLVVRLEGTEVEEGRAILAQSGLNIIAATDLSDAAEKAVAAARQSGG